LNEIEAAVIHKLEKAKHGKSSVVPSASVLSLNDAAKKLIGSINDLYSERANKGYGRFHANETQYPTAGTLRSVFSTKAISFFDGSRQLMDLLATRADQAQFATGGFVLMAHIIGQAGANWFLVAIITNVDGSVINDRLEVKNAEHVDLENLRVAGRVNIAEWLNGASDKRYVGFLKHRGDIAEYFKYFLGCDDLVKGTEETKGLVAALKQFATDEGLDPARKEEFYKAAYSYCHERKKKNEPLSLDELVHAAWPEKPKELAKALATGNVQISDGFVPDGRVLKQFVNIRARTKYWSVDLDRHGLQTGDFRYDKKRGELVLKNLPADLKAELEAEIGDGT